jgi:transcriptional regulator with XRE-family HTH domain
MTPSNVKTLRRRLGWTQRQLAAALNVTVPTVARWEQGARSVTPLAATTLTLLDAEHRLKHRRLTINFEAPLYVEIETLAKSLGLGLASCGRMLIIEALAMRAASPRRPHA